MSPLVLLALALGPDPAQLVKAGQAGRAYAALTEEIDEEQVDRAAPDVVLLADLLRYLRCVDPAPPPSAVRGVHKQARTLLDLELKRVDRARRENRRTGPDLWNADGSLSWKLPPAPQGKGATISWPTESERWSDETIVVLPPEVKCGKVGPRREKKPRTERARLAEEAEAARSARLGSRAGFPPRVALLLDEAVLRARLGDWPEVWVLARLLEEEAAQPGAGPLAPREQAEAAILGAVAAEHDERDDEALKRWDRAAALPLGPDEKLFVDVQRQRLLIATGRLREARALLDGYGELGGELGRYLRYRNALARFQSGDEGGTLALARGLLGRRSIAESSVDPIAHATEELVYLQLARHPFSPEQIEVVESIGLVGELYLRMEALAGIALERGRPELAAQIDRWLLDKQPKTAYGRPGWLGRLAVAAAELGDAAAFQAAIGPLFDEAMQPLPKTKRGPAHRSIEWDRQILLMTRDCVNPLVARRGFASLKLLVDELQRYLRAQKKPTYPELTDLYRLASSQLPPSPRAYAEKVGREHQPVWIGQVTLDRPTVVVPQPEQTLPRLRGPVTLLCIPDGRGGCPRWLGPPAKEPRDAR